jgi:hypothetical protein
MKQIWSVCCIELGSLDAVENIRINAVAINYYCSLVTTFVPFVNDAILYRRKPSTNVNLDVSTAFSSSNGISRGIGGYQIGPIWPLQPIQTMWVFIFNS